MMLANYSDACKPNYPNLMLYSIGHLQVHPAGGYERMYGADSCVQFTMSHELLFRGVLSDQCLIA